MFNGGGILGSNELCSILRYTTENHLSLKMTIVRNVYNEAQIYKK